MPLHSFIFSLLALDSNLEKIRLDHTVRSVEFGTDQLFDLIYNKIETSQTQSERLHRFNCEPLKSDSTVFLNIKSKVSSLSCKSATDLGREKSRKKKKKHRENERGGTRGG